ncbi:hypothetical protein H696_03106 [Fonticula alba]|uniref:Peptidase M28 domain-containing protein n=1 Tax=Fonticula alba TaxID=691883 RepID=A0A058Z903_FONAL|nr:hypothetical protein H696_03106 [Fonticula alba]KCV70755.1 hypothetical protein H696_03106 [Fonticula alba]|eukprot:XP_009495271.1 hypothetical protein H696_03106 [Fonticula alba]
MSQSLDSPPSPGQDHAELGLSPATHSSPPASASPGSRSSVPSPGLPPGAMEKQDFPIYDDESAPNDAPDHDTVFHDDGDDGDVDETAALLNSGSGPNLATGSAHYGPGLVSPSPGDVSSRGRTFSIASTASVGDLFSKRSLEALVPADRRWRSAIVIYLFFSLIVVSAFLIVAHMNGLQPKLAESDLDLGGDPFGLSEHRARDNVQELVNIAKQHHGEVLPSGLSLLTGRVSTTESATRTRQWLERKVGELVALAEEGGSPAGCTVTLEVRSHNGVINTIGRDSAVISYADVVNVAARVTWPGVGSDAGALLVSAHYDSVIHSPGASDNGASVAAALEVLRALVISPTELPFDVIFLFDDAEESGLLGMYGFIHYDPWFADVRAHINLDSAGGWRIPLLTQMGGSNNPYALSQAKLARAYAGGVSPPHASALVTDIYALLPSFTNYYALSQMGIPGLDIDLYQNGYSYHTRLDGLDDYVRGTLLYFAQALHGTVQQLALAGPLPSLSPVISPNPSLASVLGVVGDSSVPEPTCSASGAEAVAASSDPGDPAPVPPPGVFYDLFFTIFVYYSHTTALALGVTLFVVCLLVAVLTYVLSARRVIAAATRLPGTLGAAASSSSSLKAILSIRSSLHAKALFSTKPFQQALTHVWRARVPATIRMQVAALLAALLAIPLAVLFGVTGGAMMGALRRAIWYANAPASVAMIAAWSLAGVLMAGWLMSFLGRARPADVTRAALASADASSLLASTLSPGSINSFDTGFGGLGHGAAGGPGESATGNASVVGLTGGTSGAHVSPAGAPGPGRVSATGSSVASLGSRASTAASASTAAGISASAAGGPTGHPKLSSVNYCGCGYLLSPGEYCHGCGISVPPLSARQMAAAFSAGASPPTAGSSSGPGGLPGGGSPAMGAIAAGGSPPGHGALGGHGAGMGGSIGGSVSSTSGSSSQVGVGNGVVLPLGSIDHLSSDDDDLGVDPGDIDTSLALSGGPGGSSLSGGKSGPGHHAGGSAAHTYIESLTSSSSAAAPLLPGGGVAGPGDYSHMPSSYAYSHRQYFAGGPGEGPGGAGVVMVAGGGPGGAASSVGLPYSSSAKRISMLTTEELAALAKYLPRRKSPFLVTPTVAMGLSVWFVYSIMLLILSVSGFGMSYLVLYWSLMFLPAAVIWSVRVSMSKARRNLRRLLAAVALLLWVALPLTVHLFVCWAAVAGLIPMLDRFGSTFPGDAAFGAVVGILTGLGSLPLLVIQTRASVARTAVTWATLAVALVGTLLLAASLQPYDALHPRRVDLMHMYNMTDQTVSVTLGAPNRGDLHPVLDAMEAHGLGQESWVPCSVPTYQFQMTSSQTAGYCLRPEALGREPGTSLPRPNVILPKYFFSSSASPVDPDSWQAQLDILAPGAANLVIYFDGDLEDWSLPIEIPEAGHAGHLATGPGERAVSRRASNGSVSSLVLTFPGRTTEVNVRVWASYPFHTPELRLVDESFPAEAAHWHKANMPGPVIITWNFQVLAP